MDPRQLTVIVNTGDDIVLHGLSISPDLDIVTYTLADLVNRETGWGFRNDTFHFLEQLAVYCGPQWFHLGDRDLATHVCRTAMLHAGKRLSEVTDWIRKALGVGTTVLPMSDQQVPTMIQTNEGRLHFQEYLVERRAEPTVQAISFEGVAGAFPAPGVLEALEQARSILICPSNPLISIGPILAIPGIRETLQRRRSQVLAVCPIVGGKSLKGPSDQMLAQLGHDVSAVGVARMYQDICGTMVIDPLDNAQIPEIEALAMKVVVHPTIMRSQEDKDLLARRIMELARSQEAGAAA
jgi:LPPG:FO 2-phospho-L-lactate transferase